MNIKDELIKTAKNNVGPGFGYGTADKNALKTSEEFVYRVTGMDQITDIIDCGYVRPKGYGKRSQRVGHKIYWSIGGKNVHYNDKRPVIQAPIDKISDGQIGSIPITDLSAIWIYNNEKEEYENKLKEILQMHLAKIAENKINEQEKSK